MIRRIVTLFIVSCVSLSHAQEPLTPEMLWQLGRVSIESISPDKKHVLYQVTHYDMDQNRARRSRYRVPVMGGHSEPLIASASISYEGRPLENVQISPDGRHVLFTKPVLVNEIHSVDRYPGLPKSDAYVYDDLDYRHWDQWADGTFNHIFYAPYENGQVGQAIDIMDGQPYHSPQKPFGGAEDVIWSPDGQSILYVSKKKVGKDYALSTNTDLYRYDLTSGETVNLTEGMLGYDRMPAYSPGGQHLAWLSMAEDGFEADKNDIIVWDMRDDRRYNLTKDWDGTVNDFVWSDDGRTIWFRAPFRGTVQLFEIKLPSELSSTTTFIIEQISEQQRDVSSLAGQAGNQLIVTVADMNHPDEVYRFDLSTRQFSKITGVNDELNARIAKSRVEARITTASDGKDLLSWVIYPPDFDSTKKYPTLLYCRGGPQGALSQEYSYRWSFQLMAAQGYIVVAPNRRGMPGYGVEWNNQISGDWGGQAIRDHLAAIDMMAKEPYVDEDRLAAVGPSYGGYSVFMLAGIHQNRFKTFVSHAGLFDMRSWYGTTEELFFANKELGGPYWEEANQKSYTTFNPIEYIDEWDTPILIIHGNKDYRVGIEQSLEAFQAAQLKGIKSRLLYFPEENHRVLQPQNALVWQHEFFKWLEETL